jgi:hypothetical protein
MDGNLCGWFGSCKAYGRNSTSKLITHAKRIIIKPPKKIENATARTRITIVES